MSQTMHHRYELEMAIVVRAWQLADVAASFADRQTWKLVSSGVPQSLPNHTSPRDYPTSRLCLWNLLPSPHDGAGRILPIFTVLDTIGHRQIDLDAQAFSQADS